MNLIIAGDQKRRMEQLVRRAVGLELAAAAGFKNRRADPHYASTNRIMERWAVGIGSGLPNPDEDRVSRPPPLDNETQIVVDKIVQHSPRHIQMFVRQWYCSPVPCVVLAQQRGIHHSEIYDEWRAVLAYLKERFEESAHAPLMTLVKGPV